jgi:hypothetical protein
MDQPRTPPASINLFAKVLYGDGLGRHGPIFFVGPPRRNHGYAIGAPPRIWGRGAPVTVHSTVAAYPHSSATC